MLRGVGGLRSVLFHLDRPGTRQGFRLITPGLIADAKRLGIPLGVIFNTLQANLGSAYANDFNLFGRVYRVMIQADGSYRRGEPFWLKPNVDAALSKCPTVRSVVVADRCGGGLDIVEYTGPR